MHHARQPIRIGNSYLRCSFTVIEHGEIDLLVGLDVLRAHRCDISLSKNRMKFHAGGGAKEVNRGQGTSRGGLGWGGGPAGGW